MMEKKVLLGESFWQDLVHSLWSQRVLTSPGNRAAEISGLESGDLRYLEKVSSDSFTDCLNMTGPISFFWGQRGRSCQQGCDESEKLAAGCLTLLPTDSSGRKEIGLVWFECDGQNTCPIPSWVFFLLKGLSPSKVVHWWFSRWTCEIHPMSIYIFMSGYTSTVIHIHTRFIESRYTPNAKYLDLNSSHWQQHQSLGQKQTKTKFWQDNPKTFGYTALLQSKDRPPHGGVKLDRSRAGFRMSVGQLEALLQMLIRGDRAAAS